MKEFGKTQRNKWRLIKAFVFLAYVVIYIAIIRLFEINWIGGTLLLLSSILIYIYIRAEDIEMNFTKGISGEELMEKELKNVANIDYFRDLTIEEGKWNIDFVVVASTGVYVLEVKSYEGRIKANGDSWFRTIKGKRRPLGSFSKQAKSNAFKLREYLSTKISMNLPYFTPIVVLTNPFQKEDISINNSNYFVSGIEDLTIVMDSNYKLNPVLRDKLVTELRSIESKGF